MALSTLYFRQRKTSRKQILNLLMNYKMRGITAINGLPIHTANLCHSMKNVLQESRKIWVFHLLNRVELPTAHQMKQLWYYVLFRKNMIAKKDICIGLHFTQLNRSG